MKIYLRLFASLVVCMASVLNGLSFAQPTMAGTPFIEHTLAWNAFYGGTGSDTGAAIAVDAQGNVYIAGLSQSAWGEDPVNPFNGDGWAGPDVFVAKINSHGRLLWHTFMGSPGWDGPSAIVLDPAGNIYVSGTSQQSWGTPVQAYSGGDRDGFIAKLNPYGVRLWHTFVGSSAADGIGDIELGGSGGLYSVGYSGAAWGSPLAPFIGGADAFLAYLDGDSGQLRWNTFMGSAEEDNANKLVLDDQERIYITGASQSTWGSPAIPFPENSGKQAFAASFSQEGVLLWNTFLGAGSVWLPDDDGKEIGVDLSGHVFVQGSSLDNWGNPIVPYHPSGNDHTIDGFVARLDAASGDLQWNTFIGDFHNDTVNGMIIEPGSGNIYVTGEWGVFTRGFIMQLDTDGTEQWFQDFGYTTDRPQVASMGNALALDEQGSLYLTGVTPDNNGWGDCVRDPFVGNGDMMLLRFGPVDPDDPVLRVNPTSLKFTVLENGSNPPGQALAISNCCTGGLTYTASETSSWLALENASGSAPYTMTVSIDASGLTAGVYTTDIRVESNGVDSPQIVSVQLTVFPFIWNTFLGSEAYDTVQDMVVDEDGNTFITGTSEAAWGSPIRLYSGDADVFVLKLNLAGEREWLTFLGSTDRDSAGKIQIDSLGNVYIVGSSVSTWGSPINPITSWDGFLAKLDGEGTLLWHTFFGASDDDYPGDVPTALDLEGDDAIFVTGSSSASWGTPFSLFSGINDIFVVRFSASGERQWNTFLGSDLNDFANDLVADRNGGLYLTGSSEANWNSAITPVRAHADDGGYPANDGWVARLSTAGDLDWYTFWGEANSYELFEVLLLDGAGNLYAGGQCGDNCWGTTVDGEEHYGEYDGALAKYSATTGERAWLRFMGNGTGYDDRVTTLALDGAGNIRVAGDGDGEWGSTTALIPHQGGSDAFYASINPDGQRIWHAFVGTPYGEDAAEAVTMDTLGNMFLAGNSYLEGWGSPLIPYAGGWDGFVARLGNFSAPLPILNVAPAVLSMRATQGGANPSRTLSITNGSVAVMTYTAEANVAWLSIELPAGNVPGVITVTADPSGLDAGTYQGQVTITGSSGAQNSPQVIPVTLDIIGSAAIPRFLFLPLVQR